MPQPSQPAPSTAPGIPTPTIWPLVLPAAAGAATVWAWDWLPLWAWLGLVAALVAGAGGFWLSRRQAARLAQARQARESDRLLRLERRAHQLDEAEHLVALSSFDWFPKRGELHWSEQHYRLWGLEPGSVTPSFELFERHLHPDDKARVTTQLQQALDGKSRYDCRHRVLREDGSVRHVHARGEVYFDVDGKPERMIGAVLDITDRVQAESAQRVFEFVLDAITDTVSAIDSDMTYRLANAAWYETTGISRRRGDPISFNHVFPLVFSPERRQAVAQCLVDDQVHVVRGPIPAPLKPGRIMETRYFPFHDPAVSWRGIVMVSRDVTDDEAVRTELATSLDNLRLTLNTIGDAIFATDATRPDDPVLFANDQLLQLWRIPPERAQPLTARTIVEFARGWFRDPDAEIRRIQWLIETNSGADDRLELTDGRMLLRRCRPTELQRERPVRVWTFRDITAEVQALRALAQAEARQRTLLAAFPGFIWVIDDSHRLAYINPMAARVYEPLLPEVGMPIEKIFGRTTTQRLLPSIDRALAGETVSIEWHRKSRSGRSPDDMLIKMAPGTSPEGHRFCYAFGIDISSLKQAEAALVAAKDEAERANRAKTQFLSSMSHELRTPLNAVIGFSQVLQANGEGNLNDRQVRQLGEIHRAGQHLLSLINDLLDLARIEAGRTTLDLAPVPLAELVDDCLQLMQPLAARQQRQLLMPAAASPLPAVVMADRVRLKQVLLNLLSNAIKYNRPQGRVTLRWTIERGDICIEVADEGPGLSPDQQARLFKPFERLQAEHTDTEGTGIGLALSRHLVLLMQGDIGVRSEPGRGSCFWVRLPRADAPAALPPAAPSQRHLLYVDDHPVNLTLMEGLFEDHADLQLTTMSDAAQALQALQQRPADVLLVDLQMPGLDGFEVFQRLQADPHTRQMPVIAVSADATPETAERCRRSGFADLVTKPVDADRLFQAVDRALGPRAAGPAGQAAA